MSRHPTQTRRATVGSALLTGFLAAGSARPRLTPARGGNHPVTFKLTFFLAY